MKQWRRQNYVLTHADIDAGRTDWWERMESRTEGFVRAPRTGMGLQVILHRCLHDADTAAHLGVMYQLLSTDDPWVEETVGDLGLDVPFVTDNAGLNSQMYAGIWYDLRDALDADGSAGALALRAELWALGGVPVGLWLEEWYPDKTPNYKNFTAFFIATVLLARLNRVKYWLKAATEEEYQAIVGWAGRQKYQRHLGMLKRIEASLIEGRPLPTGSETAVFMGLPSWDPAYCYAERDGDFWPPYTNL